MKKYSLNKNGFSLSEMLIVVAIIGVLTGLSLPTFASTRKKANEETCEANRRSMRDAIVRDYTKAQASGEDLSKIADKENVIARSFGSLTSNFTCPEHGEYRVYVKEDSTDILAVTITCKEHTSDSEIKGIEAEGYQSLN